MDNIDYRDGYDERMNPYYGKCPIHGNWKGPYDECPDCKKLSYDKDYNEVPNSICWHCQFCGSEEPGIYVYCEAVPKLRNLRQKPRKNKCKWFKDEAQ